jgi:serine/threonine-protein kinase
MADPIQPAEPPTGAAASPTDTPGTPREYRGAFQLPPKLLESAAKRIALLSVFVAILVVVVHVFQQWAQPQLQAVYRDPINQLIAVLTVLSAGGLFALGHYRVVTSSMLLTLAMAFEVLVAFSISMMETTLPIDANRPMLGMSSLGPWVFALGVLIPNRPLFTLITALTAATMWPVAYAINAQRFHFAPAPWGPVLAWPVINYLLAGLGALISRWTFGTAIAAQAARDLGSYRLVAPIGRGGMGEVWRATHQMLARQAAIKLVKRDLTAGSSRQAELSVRRFRREANVIASLQSPHTVYLYDFGVSQEGHFYYVMELLDGISLQELIETFGPQPAARVAAILRQALESLEEAHATGLVHRDLKPSNIMLCKVALEHDVVKVLDFGLAKFVDRVDRSQLTIEGVAAGTPGYMAPEIALGDTAVDARADLYAIGCVAYFLLTGSLVFPDPSPITMALKHVQAPPDPPSTRTELPIPPAFEQLVLQCLAKKPDARPAGAREIIDLLDACHLEPWTRAHAAEWWNTHLPATSTLRSFAQSATFTPPAVQKM